MKQKSVNKKPSSYKVATLTFDLSDESGRWEHENALNGTKIRMLLDDLLQRNMRNVTKYESVPDFGWIEDEKDREIFIKTTDYWRGFIYQMLLDEGLDI